MFAGDAEIGEDEEPPVRRDVFRTVKFGHRGARGVPLALGMLQFQDLRSPAFPSDLPLLSRDLGVARRFVEELSQDAEADARIRFFGEKPIPHATGQRHAMERN
jgi:hypothetical protein